MKARNSVLSEFEQQLLWQELFVLDRLIPVKAHGFRGLVLTAMVAMLLDPTYRATQDLYACHPRPLFEQGIFYALRDARIPSGKSDPLNVAKVTIRLDCDWAAHRRPKDVAKAALKYVQTLEANWHDHPMRELLIKAFFIKLLDYANELDSYVADEVLPTMFVPIIFGKKLADFCTRCPESGAIPQFVVGHLLAHVYGAGEIDGLDESVFATNTTSKKLGDLRVGEDIYEVTVKDIDRKRLDDCADVLLRTDHRMVTFVCDMPRNVSQLTLVDEHVCYRGIGFQFVDIRTFVRQTFMLLGPARQTFLQEFHAFVSEPCRTKRTKQLWSEAFSNG